MADQKHRSEIEVIANDSEAQKRLDAFIAKLEKARDLAANIAFGGMSPAVAGFPYPASAAPGGAASSGTGTVYPPGGGPGEQDREQGDAPPGDAPTGDRAKARESREERDRAREEARKAREAEQARVKEERERTKAERDALAKQQAEAKELHSQRARAANVAVNEFRTVTSGVSSFTPATPIEAVGGTLSNASMLAAGSKHPYAAAALAAAAVGTLPFAAGINQRHGLFMQAADLERPTEIAYQTGGVDVGPRSLAARRGAYFGYGPSESAGLLSDYYRTIGTKDASEAMLPFQAMLGGVSMGALARYASLSAPGGGAVEDLAGNRYAMRGVLGTTRDQFGLTGAKVDEVLGRIANFTQGMAERGLSVNLTQVNALASRLGNTDASFAGSKAYAAALKMTSLGPDAAQGFAGNFSGLSQAALLAQAAQGGGDILSVIDRLQNMTGKQSLGALRGMLGAEGTGLALAGQGLSARQARAAARGLGANTVTWSDGAGRAESQRLAATRAEGERKLLADNTADYVVGQEMLKAVHGLQQFLINRAKDQDYWMRKVLRALGSD